MPVFYRLIHRGLNGVEAGEYRYVYVGEDVHTRVRVGLGGFFKITGSVDYNSVLEDAPDQYCNTIAYQLKFLYSECS